jgi:hypothetical protein
MLSALPLPTGDLGTFMTLGTMRSMVAREFLLPVVRLTATDIVAGLGGADGVEQAHMIREWIDAHTEFLRDPDKVEMLHGPSWQVQRILQTGRIYVDCDDVAMLAAALGRAVGLRARFVVVGFSRQNAPFRHVWAELSPRRPQPQWIEMDLTRAAQEMPFNNIRRVLTVEV